MAQDKAVIAVIHVPAILSTCAGGDGGGASSHMQRTAHGFSDPGPTLKATAFLPQRVGVGVLLPAWPLGSAMGPGLADGRP